MESSVPRGAPWRAAQAMLVVGYGAAIVLSIVSPLGPRVFWTILMPLVPLGFVLAGFHVWRRVCPLATIASLGAHFAHKRRVPRWLARHPLTFSFALLALMLWARLIATNGDPVALGAMLLALAAIAALINLVFSGKTWCNYVCPVGVVEHLYTDAGALRGTEPSACRPCVGCARACPDIDQERSYDASRASADRRLATFAFPGLVLGFYGYFQLREGTWAAFFDGRWTERAVSADLFLGAGFSFEPRVPAAIAAALTLSIASALSFALFAAIERALRGFVARDVLRHRMLAGAAFVALNLFYVFAGAPSLSLVPGAQRVVAFVVPVVATLVLVRRWARGPKRKLPVVSG